MTKSLDTGKTKSQKVIGSAKSNHLVGLDTLRWYSALAVIITHVELSKGYRGYANVGESVWIQNLGPVGVYFFFTLSGFLITWLLLKKCGRPLYDILPDFYRRRCWRILPLYYLLVAIGFFILPLFPAFSKGSNIGVEEFLAFVAIQPHVASAFQDRVPNISHLWSIGVEFTFYCFWPLIVLRSRNLKRAIGSFIVGVVSVKALLIFLGPVLLENPQSLFHFAATLKFECMAIGAWFALTPGKRIAELLDRPLTVWCAIVAIPLVFMLYGTRLDNVVHLPLSVLFGIIIRSTSFSQGSPVRSLDNRVTEYLGKISYGVYCYHVMCISLAFFILPMDKLHPAWGNILLYAAVLIFTVLISAASYELFELPLTRRAQRGSPAVPNATTKRA